MNTINRSGYGDILDSNHEIISDVKLCGGGVLHRFNNPAGVPYSAIYQDSFEAYSAPREREADMIEAWNNRPCFKEGYDG